MQVLREVILKDPSGGEVVLKEVLKDSGDKEFRPSFNGSDAGWGLSGDRILEKYSHMFSDYEKAASFLLS